MTDGQELNKITKQSIWTYDNKRSHLSSNYKAPNFTHKKSSKASLTGSDINI